MIKKIPILLLSILFISFGLNACRYSFTGGSVPEHIKSLYIAPVIDNSNFGNPQYRVDLNTLIIDDFRSDNSFNLVESGGDARLEISISSITEVTGSVSTGEIEDRRKVQVTCKVFYFDKIKKKKLLEKSFNQFKYYELSEGMSGRDDAIKLILDDLSSLILEAVVSGW